MLVGKTVLIGFRYQNDGEQEPEEHKQWHGVIRAVTDRGIDVRLEGTHAGESKSLPPDLRVFHEAPPGEYIDRANGDTITDPDFIAAFRVSRDQ